MPRKKLPEPTAGHAYRRARGLVGTVVYATPEERDRARQAAKALGVSLQEFAREALRDRSTQVLGR